MEKSKQESVSKSLEYEKLESVKNKVTTIVSKDVDHDESSYLMSTPESIHFVLESPQRSTEAVVSAIKNS